jgi:hypothetical protein
LLKASRDGLCNPFKREREQKTNMKILIFDDDALSGRKGEKEIENELG